MALSLLELVLYRARHRLRLLRFALTAKPVAGGEDPPDPGAKDPAKDPDPKDPAKDDPDPDPEKIDPDDDWKTKSRKHENALKRERKAREEAERKLKEREDADKSETERAIEKAREEAATAARAEGDKERRADRLEVAVTRLAARGVKIGEGDDAKVVRFADPEDALLNVQRAIDRGDIDPDDIFDAEGKVSTDALTKAVADIADAKPHLLTDGAERRRSPGDPDARKGDPASGDLEGLSPEDHAKRKYGNK